MSSIKPWMRRYWLALVYLSYAAFGLLGGCTVALAAEKAEEVGDLAVGKLGLMGVAFLITLKSLDLLTEVIRRKWLGGTRSGDACLFDEETSKAIRLTARRVEDIHRGWIGERGEPISNVDEALRYIGLLREDTQRLTAAVERQTDKLQDVQLAMTALANRLSTTR